MSPPVKLRAIQAVIMTAIFMAAHTALAQHSPREIFERARMLDEGNQNLSEAIRVYGQVAEQAKGDRTLAARAQWRVGVLYERLGRKVEARRAYQALVNRFTEQAEIVRRARLRISALNSKGTANAKTAANENNSKLPSALMVRQVLAGHNAFPDRYIQSTPSPSGRYLCYTDGRTRDLAVRDLFTGRKRRLTANQRGRDEEKGVPQFPIFSPDGRRIAYGWVYQGQFRGLRLIGLDGSHPRILYRSEEAQNVMPADWSRNGQQILALVRRKDGTHQIAVISAMDGSARVLKTLDRRAPEKMSFSPDGRWIAYDFPPRQDATARDIYLIVTDGSRETALIEHPAHDRLLGWTPDGERILFGSNRDGTMSAWTIRVTGGAAQGGPEMVKPNLGRIFPLGFTRRGVYYYGQEIGHSEAFIAALDPQTGQLLSPATPLGQRFIGPFPSPDWSRDGRYLVYVSPQGPGLWKPFGPRKLIIRSTQTGKESELSPALSTFGGPRWSPDGRSILVIGMEESERRGLYLVDAQTGVHKPIVLTDPKAYWAQQAEWSPDGSLIYYAMADSVLVYHFKSDRVQEIYRGPAYTLALAPAGQELAVAAEHSLKVLPVDGGEPREVLTVPKGEWITTVAWTPDGHHLLFGRSSMARQGQDTELWRVRAEGGEPQKLAVTMDGLRELRVHPNGHQVVFASFQLRHEIWALENFLPATRSRRTFMSQR